MEKGLARLHYIPLWPRISDPRLIKYKNGSRIPFSDGLIYRIVGRLWDIKKIMWIIDRGMNKHALYLAGLLNEEEFDRMADVPKYGDDAAGRAQGYAYNLGVLQGTTKVVKSILESALRQLESPEWSREDDGGLMLEHLEKAVREALEKIKAGFDLVR